MPTSLEPELSGTILNNMVVELIHVQQPPPQADAAHTFTNPRNGWVLFASATRTQGAASVTLTLHGDARDHAIAHHEGDDGQTKEAMRLLPAGDYTLDVHCQGGAELRSLSVRTVPEISYPGLGYRPSPWIVSYPRYDWPYLEAIGMAANINVILERSPDQTMDVGKWRSQGRKVLTRASTHMVDSMPRPITAEKVLEYWTSVDGLRRADRDGVMFDELHWKGDDETYTAYIAAVKQLAADPAFKGKLFHPYTTPMYHGKISSEFVKATIAAGYTIAEERYIAEQPSEDEARKVLQEELVENTRRYQELVPDCQRHMIICLGYMTAPPEWLNVNPGVNWKVFQDMQYHLLANDPTFAGLYGVQCYHSAYADEEVQRWQAQLFRHYCIEGRRERLTQDPYMLPHLQNADFAAGADGWTLTSAEPGSIDVRQGAGYSWLQGRYPRTEQGDTFLRTKRSADAPNRFSQRLKALERGRLYSLKMFTADYQEFVQRKSDRATHQVSIGIDAVTMLDDKCFHELFPSGLAGHAHDGFDRNNNLWITYHRLVFRAQGAAATLTVSDWKGADDPGGPVGQELMHNFVEVQPYLED